MDCLYTMDVANSAEREYDHCRLELRIQCRHVSLLFIEPRNDTETTTWFSNGFLCLVCLVIRHQINRCIADTPPGVLYFHHSSHQLPSLYMGILM
jgi:hypothetical protein